MMGEGTVNDEELVEVIARGVAPAKFWPVMNDEAQEDLRIMARTALSALRSAGFETYRPEDCERFSLGHCCEKHRRHYLLVPADSGGSG